MKTLNKKIAAGLLIGSLCIASLGATVFASSQTPANDSGTSYPCVQGKTMPSHHKMMGDAKTKLDKLVKDGVISADQENKLIALFKEKAKEMKANMEKMKNLTPEERQAQFKEMQGKHAAFAQEIKTAANLSDDQLKAVFTAMRPQHQMLTPEQMTEKLSKLVSDNVITQAQSDSVVSFMKNKADERKAAMDKVRQMTPDERKAYFEEHAKNRADFVNDLKSAAGLSDEQATAVLGALHPHQGHHGTHAQKQETTN